MPNAEQSTFRRLHDQDICAILKEARQIDNVSLDTSAQSMSNHQYGRARRHWLTVSEVFADEETVHLDRLTGLRIHVSRKNGEQDKAQRFHFPPHFIEQQLAGVKWHQRQLDLNGRYLVHDSRRTMQYTIFVSLRVNFEQHALRSLYIVACPPIEPAQRGDLAADET